MFPMAVAVSADGQTYETGLTDKILHRSDH
jgi:hypothetical protein